jgi:hypothetical protein
MMPLYVSHKEVHALKIRSIVECGSAEYGDAKRFSFEEPDQTDWVLTGEQLAHKPIPEVGHYLVFYKDGYISFSPAATFEAGYTKIEQ